MSSSPRPAPDRAVVRYAIAVGVTVFAILSQYFLPQSVPALRPIYETPAGDLFVVYGIPVLAFALLVGAGPLRAWATRMRDATVEGLSWYGALTVLSLLVTVALTVVYLAVDPGALELLSRENPALTQAAGNPWFWIGFSFVIGAFEETIFRGWIFGFWRGRARNWVVPAVWTSVLFAGVHLYYGTTYGVAAPLIFPTLFLLGFSFAATYQMSGGNLVVIALLHGAYDATAFLTLVNTDAALILRYGLVLVGMILAIVRFLRDGWSPLSPRGRVAVPDAPASAPAPAFPSGPAPPGP